MAGTIKRTAGPLALTTTYTTNVYNQTSALIYDVVRQITVNNKTGSSATFRLYLGLTGANTAGTEIFFDKSVASFDTYNWYGTLRMASTDFLVGGASAATTLTITIMGDQYVV